MSMNTFNDVARYTDTVIGDPAAQIAVADCIACMRACQTADLLTTAQAMVELDPGLTPFFWVVMAYIARLN